MLQPALKKTKSSLSPIVLKTLKISISVLKSLRGENAGEEIAATEVKEEHNEQKCIRRITIKCNVM